jgi:hypothetical protein
MNTQEEVKKAFKEFLDQPIPKEVAFFEIRGESVVLEVFDYTEDNETRKKIWISADNTAEGIGYRTFPVAKILIAGRESYYKAGDIVKLRDYDARTIPNPKYETWNNNPYSKSNVTRVGQEPQAVINNMRAAYGAKMFSLTPLAEQMEERDYVTYKLADANIECKILNPYGLLDS